MKVLFYIFFAFLTNFSLASNISTAEKQLNQYIDSFFVANGMTYSEAEAFLFSFKKRVNSITDFNKYVNHKLKRKNAFNTKKFVKAKHLVEVARISNKIIKHLENELYYLIKANNLWDENTFITKLNIVHKKLIYWDFTPFKPIEIYDMINDLSGNLTNKRLVDKIHFIYYIQKIVFSNHYKNQKNLLNNKLEGISVKYITLQKKDSLKQSEILDTIGFDTIDPFFPGGESLMFQFISSNFIYPEYARINGLAGTIYIKFVIGVDGSVKDIQCVKTSHTPADILCKEGVRVISMMPKWRPGFQAGLDVNVRYILPLKCAIN